MFIGIVGPICSGKQIVADFLATYGFQWLRLRHSSPKSLASNDVHALSNGIDNIQINAKEESDSEIRFDSMAEMADYVTQRWTEHFVTVDICTPDDLAVIAKRPFFLLVSVDAPLILRWSRYNARYSHIPTTFIHSLRIHADVLDVSNIKKSLCPCTTSSRFLMPISTPLKTAYCLCFNMRP